MNPTTIIGILGFAVISLIVASPLSKHLEYTQKLEFSNQQLQQQLNDLKIEYNAYREGNTAN